MKEENTLNTKTLKIHTICVLMGGISCKNNLFFFLQENSTVICEPLYYDLWPLGSELCLRRAPGGAATGGAGGPVAMAMRRASQRPAGVRQQLQLEKRHLCGAADPSTARPVSSAGQRPGR